MLAVPLTPSPPEDLLLQRTLSRLSAIHLVLLRNSPCTPGHPLLQRTLSRLAAIHLVLLRNSPCTPGHPLLLRNSPCTPGHPLSPDGDSPCTTGHPPPQRTFSRLTAIHLVLLRNSPCKYVPVSSTAASCPWIPVGGGRRYRKAMSAHFRPNLHSG